MAQKWTHNVLPPVHSARSVILNVYDLSKGIKDINDFLLEFQAGAFHAGVQVYDREYFFSGSPDPRDFSGIGWHNPRQNDSHIYRESVYMGETSLSKEEARAMIVSMRPQWLARSYDLFRNNCCHFSDALCVKLGVGSIPNRVGNLANVAVAVGDAIWNGLQNGIGVTAGIFGSAATAFHGWANKAMGGSPPGSPTARRGIVTARPPRAPVRQDHSYRLEILAMRKGDEREVVSGGVFQLKPGENRIGRFNANHCPNFITLNDPSVSRHHCTIDIGAAGAIIKDCNSRNKTKIGAVNPKEVDGYGSMLSSGTMIYLGDLQMRFLMNKAEPQDKDPRSARCNSVPRPERAHVEHQRSQSFAIDWQAESALPRAVSFIASGQDMPSEAIDLSFESEKASRKGMISVHAKSGKGHSPDRSYGAKGVSYAPQRCDKEPRSKAGTYSSNNAFNRADKSEKGLSVAPDSAPRYSPERTTPCKVQSFTSEGVTATERLQGPGQWPSVAPDVTQGNFPRWPSYTPEGVHSEVPGRGIPRPLSFVANDQPVRPVHQLIQSFEALACESDPREMGKGVRASCFAKAQPAPRLPMHRASGSGIAYNPHVSAPVNLPGSTVARSPQQLFSRNNSFFESHPRGSSPNPSRSTPNPRGSIPAPHVPIPNSGSNFR